MDKMIDLISPCPIEPAYLSVKSKKVKPLTPNVLESKDAEASQKKKEEWPQSLKDYVQRVFATVAEEDYDQAQEELKNLVGKYHAESKLWEVDWDNMPIPEYVYLLLVRGDLLNNMILTFFASFVTDINAVQEISKEEIVSLLVRC